MTSPEFSYAPGMTMRRHHTDASTPNDAQQPVEWLKLSEQLREFRARTRCGLAEVARHTGIPVQQLAWLEGGLVRPLESAHELHRLIPKLQALLTQTDEKKENFVPPFLRG